MYSRQHRATKTGSDSHNTSAQNQFAPRSFIVQPQAEEQNQPSSLQSEYRTNLDNGAVEGAVFTRNQPLPAAPRVQMKPREQTARLLPNFVSPTHPLIQCDKAEQTERLGGTLWAKDAKGNSLPPSLEDISQGGVGDCFLFAAMAAIVNTNPRQIANMIQDNGNGTYTVTFKGMGFFSPKKQTVSADFPVDKHGSMKRNALWPLIIEKAYAQQKGGIDVLDKGGNAGNAVKDMLNAVPNRFNPQETSADYIMGKLAESKKKKWPMTINTPKKKGASKEKKAMADNTDGLYFNHAYTIIDIDISNKRIKLFNPWGRNHPNGDGWMNIEQVRKFFIEVNING